MSSEQNASDGVGENISQGVNGTPAEGYLIETLTSHEIEILIGDRRYQVTGANLRRLNDFGITLKLNWRASNGCEKFFISDLNLARAKSRQDFVSEARDYLLMAEETLREDLYVLIKAMETLQRENIKQLEAQRLTSRRQFMMKEDEERDAVEYLARHDVLSECLHEDLTLLGYAGDDLGKDVLYVAATSRKLQKPISVLSVANSAAGKSWGQEIISSLIPEDEVFSYTRLSPKSLSHFGRFDLVNKAFFLDELAGSEDEDSSQLRALLSRGNITTAYASVDPHTGKVVTLERIVEGPIALFTSTTHEEHISDETRSRFLILPIDESQKQTALVMRSMVDHGTERGVLAGGERERLRRKYQVIQKVLRPLPVVLPEAWKDRVRFNSERLSHKRKFAGYLSYVHAVCLHRQYQREKRVLKDPVSGKVLEVLVAQAEDVAFANGVMERLFAHSDGDLNPVNRRMLSDIRAFCELKAQSTGLPADEVTFSRRDIRDASHWEHMPCRRAFESLLELEYLEQSRGRERARHYYRMLPGAQVGQGLSLWTPGGEA
jgi:hypothetical protein